MNAATEPKKGITPEQQAELDECFARARKALAIIETYDQAAGIFEKMALAEDYPEFLTLPLYEAMA